MPLHLTECTVSSTAMKLCSPHILRRIRNKTTHRTVFSSFLACIDYFQDIYYRNQAGFCFENLLPNVTSQTKLLYWSGLRSESQQGPEICDVISGKRYSCYVGLGAWCHSFE